MPYLNTMNKNIIIFFLLLFTSTAFSQSNYEDVVYLKNGTIMRGTIIEQIPNKSIKIETADRNVFVFTMIEIEKFTKELIQKKNGSSHYIGTQVGYKGIIESGYQIGIGDYGMDRLKLNIINAYQFDEFVSLGFGTGMRYYSDSEALVIPVFADIRTYLSNNKISPFLAVGVGYSFDATNRFSSVGFLLSPKLGLSFKTSDELSFNFGLGYEMQKMKFYYSAYSGGYNGGFYTFNKSHNSGAININFGISF